MTVRELITELEKLPPELPVWTSCADEFFDSEISYVQRMDRTITSVLPEDDPRRHGMQPLCSEGKTIEVVYLG